MHSQFLQGLHGLAQGRQRGDTNVLDEDILRRTGATLHSVDHDDVGAGFHGQGRVVISSRSSDFNEDRFLPIGYLGATPRS